MIIYKQKHVYSEKVAKLTLTTGNVVDNKGDDERAFFALFGGFEARYLIMKGQYWFSGYVDRIDGDFGDPLTNI